MFLANLYRQDFPVVGMTSQVSVTYNMNRETSIEVDDNLVSCPPCALGDLRPRKYDVVYLGYSNDGHIGRVNLTSSVLSGSGAR